MAFPLGRPPGQTPSNLGHLHKRPLCPQVLLGWHFYWSGSVVPVSRPNTRMRIISTYLLPPNSLIHSHLQVIKVGTPWRGFLNGTVFQNLFGPQSNLCALNAEFKTDTYRVQASRRWTKRYSCYTKKADCRRRGVTFELGENQDPNWEWVLLV